MGEDRRFRFKAARQGDLDALCGIYALVNATTALVPQRLRSISNPALFRAYLSHLPQSCQLDAVQYGLEVRPLLLTARRTLAWFLEETGIEITVRRAAIRGQDRNPDWHWSVIQRACHTGVAAVIWIDGPGGAHWTVVRDMDEGALSVCDSQGWSTLHRSWCVRDQRYRLRAHKTLLLCRG